MKIAEWKIKEWISEYYGLDVSITPLNGYDELNYLITDTNENKYILKIADNSHDPYFLDAQVSIIDHLQHSSQAGQFQKYIRGRDGEAVIPVRVEDHTFRIRLLSFLEGSFWVDIHERSDLLLKRLGIFLGSMDYALQKFSHHAMHRKYVWDISNTASAHQKLHYIKDHEKRRIAGYFLLQFDMVVAPRINHLRHSYIHNDANDYNVLVSNENIAGLIDFGDMVYSATINNLAVACTYGIMGHSNPIEAASKIISGYHSSFPLKHEEIEILYYLIAARLCISVTESAYNTSLNSSNDHHFITENAAWDLLNKWIKINPVKALNSFIVACGFPEIIAKEEYDELLKKRHESIGRNLSISYKKNIKIIRGALQYLYDDIGNTFVDCVNNPSHVGHCHPVVVRRMQQQIATLNTNTRYLSDLIVEFADRLKATLPSKLKVCYFVNSGSEANDLAIRMSRCYTGQQDVIVLDHAYHGNSTLSIDISPYKFDSKGGTGQKPWVHKAINPDTYRGPYSADDPMAGEKYADGVAVIIENLKEKGLAPAAFICETLLGVGGQMPLPKGYLQSVYKHVKAAGGVCIADEVQVGFGRVGEAFWGFELQHVEPDIVVLGKPIGNGHPLGAVIVTEEIANAFNNGLEYFNTFGGNPVSMATGIAVLDVIQTEEMQEHALEVGNHLMNGLKKLMEKFNIISDVRGHGLFIGAELVRDRLSKTPAVPEIDMIVEAMKGKGFLLSTDGPWHNVLKIKPPMTFNKQNADDLCENLELVMTELGL
ncbi:MAG: aminotransferase class III-fold pyridoxal phosphate-dependent enzyme [Chitinophagaceae bacterium]